ncbi:unnamed protein product, partial [Ectocarpus sp. 6 AP-2014]
MQLMVLRLAAGARGRTRWRVSTRQPTLPASKTLCIFCCFRATFFIGSTCPPAFIWSLSGGCIAGANSSPRAFVPSAPEVRAGLTFWHVFRNCGPQRNQAG